MNRVPPCIIILAILPMVLTVSLAQPFTKSQKLVASSFHNCVTRIVFSKSSYEAGDHFQSYYKHYTNGNVVSTIVEGERAMTRYDTIMGDFSYCRKKKILCKPKQLYLRFISCYIIIYLRDEMINAIPSKSSSTAQHYLFTLLSLATLARNENPTAVIYVTMADKPKETDHRQMHKADITSKFFVQTRRSIYIACVSCLKFQVVSSRFIPLKK